MQDGTTCRRGIRKNRCDDGSVVAVGGNIDEDAVPLGDRFHGVLLDGNKVPNTLFRPRITIAGVGFVRVDAQVVAGVLVARECTNDRGVLECSHVLPKAGRERVGRVTEQADDELVVDVEARQRGRELAQGAHRLRRGETVGSTSLGQHGLSIHVDPVLV